LQRWQQKFYEEKMENPKDIKVEKDSELKEWLVNYVGNKENPDDGAVTVEMIINTVAKEFPEFLLLVAEENFLRGYEQGLDDVRNYKQGLNNANKKESNN
jgi:hypothetical protein